MQISQGEAKPHGAQAIVGGPIHFILKGSRGLATGKPIVSVKPLSICALGLIPVHRLDNALLLPIPWQLSVCSASI